VWESTLDGYQVVWRCHRQGTLLQMLTAKWHKATRFGISVFHQLSRVLLTGQEIGGRAHEASPKLNSVRCLCEPAAKLPSHEARSIRNCRSLPTAVCTLTAPELAERRREG